MQTEGTGGGRVASRRQQWVQLAVLAALTTFTTLFGSWAVLNVAEAIGPSETRTGRVLERSSIEWTNRTCLFGQRSTLQRMEGPCRTFTIPANAVTGEFPDGDTWVVVGDGTSTSPRDVAGRPGRELAVTTSNLTGRVTKLDNGRSFESTWTRVTTLGSITVIVFGGFLIVTMALLFRLRSRREQSFDLLPRPAVIGAFTGAVAIGLVGLWVGGFQSSDQYQVPSSADRYGGFVADPYDFAASAEEAEEAGRLVEFNLEGATVRTVTDTEASPALEAIVEAEPRPIVALVVESRTIVGVEVRTSDAADSAPAEPCGELEYPSEIGVDDRLSAGLFCLPENIDPAATIQIVVNGSASPPIESVLLN